MSTYVVDSNFFIQAHRAHYPFDVAVSFWDKVKQLAHTQRIISIDKVKDEIYGHNDTLEDWCRINLPQDFFKTTNSVMREYARISNWAQAKKDQYRPRAIQEFLGSAEADAFLVAYVLNNDDTKIITQEVSAPNIKTKIKIPEVCNAFNVEFMNVINMFRDLGETF